VNEPLVVGRPWVGYCRLPVEIEFHDDVGCDKLRTFRLGEEEAFAVERIANAHVPKGVEDTLKSEDPICSDQVGNEAAPSVIIHG
jgi:hypothetical protein